MKEQEKKQEKKRYSKGTILRLGKYMWEHKWLLLLAFICTIGSNLFSLIGPKLTGLSIGAIELGKGAVDFQRVFYYAAWMAVFYVISALMSYGLQVLMLTISRRVVYRMRQDVFEKLLNYSGRFESEEHLKAWLLRVAINRCHDLTRAAHQKDTELDENLPAPDAFEDGSVLDAVRSLPENYRNAIYLHYYEGYTAAEVGRMLGAPTNTVLSWLRRARAQLHTMLREEIEDEVV